jgi:ubiquinone/menaquinone biosynthesis C-methylase UbiE
MSEYFETRYTFDASRAKVWRAITEDLQRFVRTEDTVLDVGAGYCDFVNNIRARSKIAIDVDPQSGRHAGPDVRFFVAPIERMSPVTDHSVDVLFASNLLEHLDDAQIELAIAEFRRVLKAGARVILLQPNFRYAYREYFDDYTHKRIFTDVSLRDLFVAHGFEPVAVVPRYLPLTLKSRLPKSYLLTKLYLKSFFRPMAKQMLVCLRNAAVERPD